MVHFLDACFAARRRRPDETGAAYARRMAIECGGEGGTGAAKARRVAVEQGGNGRLPEETGAAYERRKGFDRQGIAW